MNELLDYLEETSQMDKGKLDEVRNALTEMLNGPPPSVDKDNSVVNSNLFQFIIFFDA